MSIIATKEDYHVDAANPFTTKTWIYGDGTKVLKKTSNWVNGFPKDNNNKQNCMYLKKPNNYKQRNDNCDQNYAYLCAVEPTFSS